MPDWLSYITALLGHGQPLYHGALCGADRLLRFFYTAIVFNPEETAENLRKYGGFIPGIRPGKRTAEYIDYVLTRMTVIGALYIAVVCLLPEILISLRQHAVLLRRHLAADRGQRDHGHGDPDPGASARPAVRGADQEAQAAGAGGDEP